MDKTNGSYVVSYSPDCVKEGDQISLSVTHLGCHIRGSPFHVSVSRRLLLEVSSTDNLAADWLDPAVATMSNIQRARLYVRLFDTNGSEVYKGTGVTKCAWSKLNITAPGAQYCDDKHNNAIQLDNGDCMLIIGKNPGIGSYHYSWDLYRPYSITIIEGGDDKWRGYNRRRLIIADSAPWTPGWSAPENRISFTSNGFTVTSEVSWPKFNGNFKIYYQPL